MNLCPHCGYELPDTAETGGVMPSGCPNCGQPLRTPGLGPESPAAPLFRYFETLWQLLTGPASFFRKMPTRGGVGAPLAFALVTHWLGSALEYLWKVSATGLFRSYFDSMFKIAGDVADVDHPGRSAMLYEFRDRVTHWMWGVGSVLADPFLTLFSILVTTLFVFVGARILVTPGRNGAPREITYESALRIVCFGMAPSILATIPFAGGLLALLATVIVTVIGAREVYRVGSGRALAIALFPKLLIFSLFVMIFALVAFFVFRMFALTF